MGDKTIIKITENDIKNMVKESLRKMKYSLNEELTRSQMESALEDLLKSRDFEKRVNNIVVDTVGDFLESMWTKKSFWKTMLKKK